MTDLSADAPIRILDKNLEHMEWWALDNSSAQTIYKGQPMILDITTDAVYLVGYVDATVVASTDIFIGIAAEGQTIATTDTEGEVGLMVWTYPTIIGFKSSVYTDADVGDTVYMSDSATLSSTAADDPMLGKLHRVLDGYAYVQLSSPTICTGA